jgi:glutaredoxin
MYAMRVALLSAIASLGALACSGEAPPPGDAEPTPPAVSEARDDLLLSWFADGGPVTASSVADVPEAARAEVRVQDPTIPPEQRDPDWVFLADLRRPDKDGGYPVRAVRRDDYEAKRRQALAAAAKAKAERAAEAQAKPLDLVPAPGAADDQVIMYANRHCPVCQKARRWLLDQKIPYVEKDIQKDRAAAQELMAKGKSQGVPVSGVPVFDVGGKLIPGFDKNAIRKALSAAKAPTGTQGII